MDDVKRWEPISDRGEGRCVQSPDGEYVEHHDYAALLARLEAVTQELREMTAVKDIHQTKRREFSERAEKAETALAAAYRMGLEAGATVCNERGIFEQENYGLKRATQNYYRARDCIRALPDKTPAEILAQIEERGE